MTIPPRPDPSKKPSTLRKPAVPPPVPSTRKAAPPPPASTARKSTTNVSRAPAAPGKPTSVRKAPASERAERAVPAEAPKSNQKMILGISAGGTVVLIVILIFVFGGDNKADKGDPSKGETKKKKEETGPSREVLEWEAAGRQKCEEGKRKITAALGPQKKTGIFDDDTRYSDIKAGLFLFDEGLALYKKAGRSTDDAKKYASERSEMVGTATRQIESEAKTLCDAAKGAVESKLPALQDAPADKREGLYKDLAEALKKLKTGMDLYKTAAEISGKPADVAGYKDVRDKGLNEILPGMEREAGAACKEGMELFEKIRDVDRNKLEGAEKERYKKDINRVYECLNRGTTLYSQAAEISDKDYSLNRYIEAKKAASLIVKEVGHD